MLLLLPMVLWAVLLAILCATQCAHADPIVTYDANTGDVQLVTGGTGVESLIVDSKSFAMLPNANFPTNSNPVYWVNDPDEYSWFSFGFPVLAPFDCGNILPLGLSNPFIQSDLTATYQTTDTQGNLPLAIQTITPEPSALPLVLGILLCRRRRRN